MGRAGEKITVGGSAGIWYQQGVAEARAGNGPAEKISLFRRQDLTLANNSTAPEKSARPGMSLGLAAILMGGSVFLSRFMGLIRDKVISYYHGAGGEADVYFTSFVVPDFINYLLAGGYFSITLIPLLAGYFARDEDSAWRLFSAVFWWVIVVSVLFTSLAGVLADPLARLVGPGYSPELQERLAFFLRIILPAQVFFLPGACLTAILYIRRRFFIPALTPLVYNGAIILGGILSGRQGMEGFCWGVLVGACLGSFILPLWAVARGGLKLGMHFRHPGLPRLVLLALPLMLGQSLVALDEQFARIFGSISGEGTVSLLNYARRLMQVPVGVVAQAAGVASFPFLADLAARGDLDKLKEVLSVALRNILAVLIPVCVWMMLAAEPIIRLIYEQGRFSPSFTGETALLLRIMLAGVAFLGVQQLIGRAFYARQDTLTPALVGTVATILTLPLYWYLSRAFGAGGIATAGVIGVCMYTAALSFIWKRRLGQGTFSHLGRHGLHALLASLAAAVPAALGAYAVTCLHSGSPLFWAFVNLAVSGVLFALTYIIITRLCAPRLLEPLLTPLPAAVRRRILPQPQPNSSKSEI